MVGCFYFLSKKKRHFDAGSLLLVLLVLYSISSLFLYNEAKNDFGLIRFFPFCYLYLMFMLAFMPILKYNAYKIASIVPPNVIWIKILSIIFIFSTFARLPDIATNFFNGLKAMLIDISAAGDIYNETMRISSSTLGDNKISNLAAIISNLFSNFGVLLLFYNLTLKKKNNFIVIGLALSCLILMLGNIAISQRGPVVEMVLTLLVTFLLFNTFIPLQIKRKVQRIGAIFMLLILIAIIVLTIGRFQNWGNGPLSSVYTYIGQQNLYFNKYGLDNGGIRYGDRTVPLFKRILGFENVPVGFWERRVKYQDKIIINDEKFISFVGDFTLDFGPYITPFIFLFLTLLVLNRTKIYKGQIAFHQLILLHLVACICVQGSMKLFTFADNGNLQLLLYIFLYYFFKLEWRSSQKMYIVNTQNSNLITR